MLFLTHVSQVYFGCKEIAKNQERKASLTFKRLRFLREMAELRFIVTYDVIYQ